jgi:hypothetical protein
VRTGPWGLLATLRETINRSPRAATALILMLVVMIIQIVAGILIARSVSEFALTIVILTAASVGGWVAGIISSPGDGAEEARFSKLSQAISVFASGYLVAKFDALTNHLFSVQFLGDSLQASRAIGILSDFVVTFIAAYATRQYGLRPDSRDEPTANSPEATHLDSPLENQPAPVEA